MIKGHQDDRGKLHVFCRKKTDYYRNWKDDYLTPRQLLKCCPKCDYNCEVKEIVKKKLESIK